MGIATNMWTVKRTLQEAFDTGGVLLFGLGCLFLFRQQYYPSVLGPLSFGMISFGAMGFVRHLAKELGSSIDDFKYQEILGLLEQRQSEIEANRCMLEELRDSCSRFMAMREILEAWQGDPSLIEERAALFAKIFQPQNVATSRESTQQTPSDIQLEPLVEVSLKESKNRDLCKEDVGVMKLDVQQEEIDRSPKTLKDQALRVTSTIFASLQRHATEKYQKEDIMKPYLETTGASKNEDLGHIHEKVAEIDIMEQGDIVLDDIGKTGDDNVECKPEETEKVSNNDIQPQDKVELQRKQSNELNPPENPQKEETKKEYLEVTEESKQEDPENMKKVTEKDIMKQEDSVLKDMGKRVDHGVECKPEEIESLSENDAQPQKKEEL